MLNYETILSNYDDKLTLMQWLKKVEAALENASATAFHVNKRGNATLTFSIDFADGTSIESDEFVLQQGESVASARIVNGQLILTLTNGDELNAGNLFNGNLTINGNISVSNNIETEFLNVRDTATLESAEIRGSASVGGGLDVVGSITGGEIVEDMVGYDFEREATLTDHFVINYVGAVKNGNKLTLVVSGVYTRVAGDSANLLIGRFIIPAAIYNKLVNNSLGALDNKAINCFSGTGVYKTVPVRITKGGLYYLNIVFYSMSTLTENTSYEVRYEVTFLLSDNLAA